MMEETHLKNNKIVLKINLMIVILASSTFLYGCGGGDDSGINNEGEGITELEGHWYSECRLFAGTSSGRSFWEKYSFAGNRFTESYIFFQDSTCTRSDSEFHLNFENSGTFVIGEEIVNNDGLDVKKLELDFDRSSFTKEYGYRINAQGSLFFGGAYKRPGVDATAGLIFDTPFNKR